MVSLPAFLTRPLVGSAFIALLTLGCSTAHDQAVPTPAPPPAAAPQNIAYYVDGQKVSASDIPGIKGDDIQYMNVIKDKAQQQSLGEAQADGVALITTKANANSPEVIAFNRRFPAKPATPAQNEAVATVQTYLKQHYPAAKVEAITLAKDQTDRYTAIFTDNGQRLQLLFDGKGNPVK